ncbi:MAG: hypothetical protein HC830_06845, partial [Bacteroidetes bacterium]|nr:hypothetical protein [Bacteroidota bacterium]
FENSKEGWRVRLNYANLKGILHTGTTDFNATAYTTTGKTWIYDASSGNPDSTAIGDWRNFDGPDHMVYLIGNYDGIRYKPYRKLRFIESNDTSYKFAFANIDNSDAAEVTIRKDTACNYTYYSLTLKDTVKIEPSKKTGISCLRNI